MPAIAKEDIFGLQNGQKAVTGYEAGLMDKSIMDAKAADEAKLRAAYKADAKNAGTADPWDQIAPGHAAATRYLFSTQLSGASAGICLWPAPDRASAGTGC